MSVLATKLKQLAEAEGDVRVASRQLRRQREVIEELERNGEDSDKAFELLLQIQETLQLRTEARDRLRRRMNAGDAARVADQPAPASRQPLVGSV